MVKVQRKKTRAASKPTYVIIEGKHYGRHSTNTFVDEKSLIEYLEDYCYRLDKGSIIYRIDAVTKMKYTAPKIKGLLTET